MQVDMDMLGRKVDLILEILERIEEDEPLEDELEAIKRYLEKKRAGNLKLIPL